MYDTNSRTGLSFAERSGYFTKITFSKLVAYLIAATYFFTVSIIILIEPFLDICEHYDEYVGDGTNYGFENPAYVGDPCRFTRSSKLCWLTPEECMFGRRIVISVVLGGIIGWERRSADRPAGIRTMALVALGSCLFSLCSSFAFIDGSNSWDASRISAAIPSGVGFLGAGMIWKDSQKDVKSGETSHTVHGLTTAASLWLSSAVGIACGGGMYFPASFSTAIVLLLLRFGPRIDLNEDFKDECELKGEKSPFIRKQVEDLESASNNLDYQTLPTSPRLSRKRVDSRPSLNE